MPFVILISIAFLLVSVPIVSAQTYSGFSKFTDNIKLFFSSGDGKVKLALEIREKELNSAIESAKSGDNEGVIKNLEAAKGKLKMVQERISPDVAEEIRSNVEGVKGKINENKDINSETIQYFEEYLSEEEKTKLSVDLSEKIFNYCKELASQNYDLVTKDEKCRSYSWIESTVKEGVEKERLVDIEKIKKEMSICMNNPKDCNCDEISLASEKANCEKYKASSIRCEFQSDTAACKEMENLKDVNTNEQSREEIEKNILEKYLPAECSEAGIRDGEECKKLILTLNQPKTECLENGKYIGEEKCKEKLIQEGNVINECVVDGKLIDSKECLKNIKEGNKPIGKEWELMSGECKERGVYDPIACDEIVNLPRPCKDVGYYTKKECETFTLKQNLPQECVDARALTPEACEKLKLPSDCQGASSREECEKIKIEQKFPDECKSQDEFDSEKCAVIMVGEQSLVVTPGAEMEYLVRQGLTFEEIPKVCMNGMNFIRSDSCDAELAKLGIILPKPTATFGIAKECMVDERTTVSPEECKNKIEKKLIIDTIPKECRDANTTNPEECGGFMEERRIDEGIGINMPSECLGISVEECKKIMQEKGIEINKIERVQKVEKVQKMCKEGEICKEEPAEYEEVTLPKECMDMGVSDVTDCKMIAGRVNEERIKNGEKIIVDENGKVDYINPEQIEKIADDSEKASQEFEPDFEKTEGMKQEINNIEKDIQEIEKVNEGDTKGVGESNNVNINEGGNNVVQQQNEVNSGDSSGGNNGKESSGNVIASDGGSSESSGSSEGNSGEDSGMTGAAIGSGDKESFLGKIIKIIFGI